MATYQWLKLVFYWPLMKVDVQNLVRECATCQRNKTENVHYPGLLQPLPIPDLAWSQITMDFIEGLPMSEHKNVILVVVDRLTKYAHFLALAHPFTPSDVVKIFLDSVYKLHGLPSLIISDRDRIFTSNVWQDLFKSLGVTLRLSTTYHPQTDGQTERVNQCLENYLRCMTSMAPRKWYSWLPMAEYWYNSSYHTSLNMTPFQAVYGMPPPHITESQLPRTITEEVRQVLQQRQQATEVIKENLSKAQARMKRYADLNRSERSFLEGDMVYLKVQPYRHTSLGLHNSLKLHSRYYGPFRIVQRVGNLAYRLLLPEHCNLHPVFHVSRLKKHIGNKVIPAPGLPLVDDEGNVKTEPVAVLARRVVPRNNEHVAQWLVQWANLPEEAATWEDYKFICSVFPSFNP
uniref:Integrase catalytic domain-containing protein n=1 Tax=Arundo donax TaxID=35708 RepID=A0A0A9GF89_ARUDO